MMTGWAIILGDATSAGRTRPRHFAAAGFRQAPRRVASAPPWTLRDERPRAQRGIFLFQGVEPRRDLLIERGGRCRMSHRGGGECETEKQDKFRQSAHGSYPRSHPIGELHTRLPRPASSDEVTPSRAERRENPKRCSDYWVLTTRDTDNAPRDCGLPVNLSFAGIVTIPAQANHPAKNLAVLSGRVCKYWTGSRR